MQKVVSIFNNKAKVSLVLIVLLLTIILNSAFKENDNTAKQAKEYCLVQIKNFQAQLDTLGFLTDSNATQPALINRFKQTRIAFKRFEFMAEYLDPAHYPFFNGANAIEMEYGYDLDIKPEGLQVIESELYEDSIDYEALLMSIKHLKYRTLTFYMILQRADLQDAYIFEAIRYNLIRIETLSLVAFDSPTLRNNVEEITAALQTLANTISFYKSNNPAYVNLQTKITQAIKFLKNKNFNNLDRLIFIKKHLHAIVQQTIALQNALQIPAVGNANTIFKAVNLSVDNIYAENFINTKFYAKDKFYTENPLLTTIGKKLFFDKRLSSNEKMSCATCHQPQKFFTDNLATAITNQENVFQQRNTPSLLNVAFQTNYFYDVRSNSLEEQAVQVVHNQQEFNHSYDSIIRKISNDTQYVRLFNEAFPQFAPRSITTTTINNCLSDFQRKLLFLNSPFDKYMRGKSDNLSATAKRGFNLFMGKAQCGSCHFAPTFFGLAPPFYDVSEAEVLGVLKTFDTIHPVLDDDIGRFKTFEIEPFKFAIKTSTVRNAQYTAPYMHNGGFKTLEDVVEFYNVGGGLGLGLAIPNQTLVAKRLQLSKQEKKDIIAFIHSLSDTSNLYKFSENSIP